MSPPAASSPLSWDLLGAFLAVMRTGSLSGASRALGVAQPTVRRQIEALEEALGVVLFTRSPSGLIPTESAAATLPYAESMAGGRGALDARDRAVDNVGALLGAGADGQAEALDLPASAFAGALMRVLAMHLRRKEPALSRLAPGLRTWARRMSRPPERLRWTGPSRHAPARGRSPFVPTTGLEVMPEGLGRGRPTIGEEQVAANQQLRILSAVASLARTKGFTQTTVADINALAGVDNRVFYRLFSDKQDAFLALHALGLEYVIDATTRAFFSVDGWPERSWRAGQAFIDLLELDPLVEYIGFVEAYSVGPAAIQRIEESHTAFAVLMQEGLALGVPVERDVGRTMIELSIAAIFELVYRHARGEGGEISERLPDIAHLWLAPLIGLDRSDAFIDGALAAHSSPTR